jgi:hypothetical protein
MSSEFVTAIEVMMIAPVVKWLEFLTTDPEVPGSSGSGTVSTQPREYS